MPGGELEQLSLGVTKEAKDELESSHQEKSVCVSVTLRHFLSLARAPQILLGFGRELPPCWETSAPLPQTSAAQGDAWAKPNISPSLASETSLGFFLALQKAMTNLLSPPREAVPDRNILGSEKHSVKNIRKSK